MLRNVALFAGICLLGCGGDTPEGAELPSIENPIGMKLVKIPPGSFTMGSPEGEPGRDGKGRERQRTVTVDKTFYISSTEVTQEQWEAVMGDNPSYVGRGPADSGHAKYPVNRVSYREAADFCAILSDNEGKTYRLPTSIEWEYACRAGTSTAYSFGNDRKDLSGYGCNGTEAVNRVASYKPNGWGLYDMHGNVWEWCRDMVKAADGSEPEPGTGQHMIRGGSYKDNPSECRSAKIDYWGAASKAPSVGFRVVLEE